MGCWLLVFAPLQRFSATILVGGCTVLRASLPVLFGAASAEQVQAIPTVTGSCSAQLHCTPIIDGAVFRFLTARRTPQIHPAAYRYRRSMPKKVYQQVGFGADSG